MFSFVLAPDHPRLQRMWLVGCGAMGGALLERWLAAGLPPSSVTVVDPMPRGLPDRFEGFVAPDAVSAWSVAPDPDTVVLGIKPQQLGTLAPGLARLLTPSPLIVSMLAGVTTDTLARHFPEAPVARIMPNTPARVGRAITAVYARGLGEADRDALAWLAEAAGSVLALDDEDAFAAVTALSGSGPAYVFRMIEAMEAAGIAAGLSRDQAARLARETLVGAAALADADPRAAADLCADVTSPGGTTEAGLAAMDEAGGLRRPLASAVKAAAQRARELARETALPEPVPPAIRAVS
jgi:pyrroline-5-carboxylate reductase